MSNSQSSSDFSPATTWTFEQNKLFEAAIVIHGVDDGDPFVWQKISSWIPGRTPEEIQKHYRILVEDIEKIESGEFPLPEYRGNDLLEDAPLENTEAEKSKETVFSPVDTKCCKRQKKKLDQYRKKGVAWTEEEHRLFLVGLEIYGKGDWRSISRTLVMSKTPTQVASHAQKYFNRLNRPNKKGKTQDTGVHDIISVESSTSLVLPHDHHLHDCSYMLSAGISSGSNPSPHLFHESKGRTSHNFSRLPEQNFDNQNNSNIYRFGCETDDDSIQINGNIYSSNSLGFRIWPAGENSGFLSNGLIEEKMKPNSIHGEFFP